MIEALSHRVLTTSRKDGIIRSFGLAERDFQIDITTGHRQKLYTVFHPDKAKKQILGFIRFSYDVKDLGVCELTNFKAFAPAPSLGNRRHFQSRGAEAGWSAR